MARNLMRREGALSPLGERWDDPFQLMRDMMRFDPWRALEAVDRGTMTGGFVPSFDVKETADAYELTADLPGIREDDIDVELNGNRLTISGKREQEERREEETYYAVERSYGSFTRSFTLPDDIDPDKCDAVYENGVLKLSLHKSEEDRPHRIRLFGKRKEESQPAVEASKPKESGKQGGEQRA